MDKEKKETIIDPELINTGLTVTIQITYDERINEGFKQLKQLVEQNGERWQDYHVYQLELSSEEAKLLQRRAREWEWRPGHLVGYLIKHYLDRLGREIFHIDVAE